MVVGLESTRKGVSFLREAFWGQKSGSLWFTGLGLVPETQEAQRESAEGSPGEGGGEGTHWSRSLGLQR